MSFQSYQICVFAVGGGAKCVRSGVGKGKMRLGVKMGIVRMGLFYQETPIN